jgi:YVTN family beta-propeller protein
VIATASGSVVNTIGGFACPFQSQVTRDGTELLVSSQCDGSVKVVNLSSSTIVNSIVVVGNPRGIALTPDGKRAYVADFFSNIVNVIDVGSQTNLHTPVTVGPNPWGIAMTPGGKAYVANFGANTISVIDTSTNTVTATLPSRGNPEDVTVSTTARPRILNYSFQTIDPPGSVITFPESVNNRGQIAGTYQDAAGVQHGFLRQGDGSFVAIDPPGSVLTAAFGINEGTVVGSWQASSVAFHGFRRSPSGVYTTVDFPRAADTTLTGINAPGRIVGQYDLGGQTTAIGFLEAHGEFTSFEDPAAAPAQTQSYGINSPNFISGTYFDMASNGHGFVREPGAQFHNFDFPGADVTFARQINDLGQIVGGYATNFPGHGFILKGSMTLNGSASPAQFLSFDYPDSQRSAARGINNSGQIVGFYFLRGDPVRHGFLATRIEDEDD